MRILLLSANRLAEPYPVYPIGLDYVRGALEPHHQVVTLDLAVHTHRASLVTVIGELEPELVGIALRNIDNTEALVPRVFVQEYRAVVEQVRAHTSAPIVLGGAAFTIAPRELLSVLGADYGIAGEGERLAQLAQALVEHGNLDDVPGLVRPEGIQNAPAPLSTSPKRTLVTPGVQLEHYLQHSGMMNLQTRRGCPFACVYCTYPRVEGGQSRCFEPTAVADTAMRLQRRGARFLFVTDAVFNADEEHCLAVAHALSQAQLSIPWGAYFTPRTTEPVFWRTLAQAGLSHVEFGTDSLDDGVLRRYGKPFRSETALLAHEAARDAGLHIAHFFTLGGPGESRETVRRTFDAAHTLSGSVCFYFVGVRIYPSTPLAAELYGEGPLPGGGLTPNFYEPRGWSLAELQALATDEIKGAPNWLLGSGGPRLAKALTRLYRLGYTGPLWEKLVR